MQTKLYQMQTKFIIVSRVLSVKRDIIVTPNESCAEMSR